MGYKKTQELFLKIKSITFGLENAEIIDKNEAKSILDKYRTTFIRPKAVFRFAFFILSFSLTLALLLFFEDLENYGLFIFGVIFWSIAEFLIRKFNLLRSGIEEGFLIASFCCFLLALFPELDGFSDNQPITLYNQFILFSVLLIMVARYRSLLFTYISFFYFFHIIFTTSKWLFQDSHINTYKIGFVFFSLIILWLSRRKKLYQNLITESIARVIKYLALMMIYLSFDAYITQVLCFYNRPEDYFYTSVMIMTTDMILSVLIPLFYIWSGVIKKRRFLINIGAACMSLTIFSVWYYFFKEYKNQNLIILIIGLFLLVSGSILHYSFKKTKFNLSSNYIKGQEPFKIFEPIMKWGERIKFK